MLPRFLNSETELAIDLGSATTVVYVRGRGVVAMEPSVVALRRRMGEARVVAVGDDAAAMLGRTHAGLQAVHPVAGGMVSDVEGAREILSRLLRRHRPGGGMRRPRAILSCPAHATPVEKRALIEVAGAAGAADVRLAEEPVAAAIGAGLDVTTTAGAMVIDVGAAKTEVAVLCLGGVVAGTHCPVGGNAFDETIATHLRRVHKLHVGPRTAQQVKIDLGSALVPEPGEERSRRVAGYDGRLGGPGSAVIGEAEIAECLADPLQAIVDTVVEVTAMVPAELAGDLLDRGIVMTGGGGRLRHLDAFLTAATGIPVTLAESPEAAVAFGMGRMLDGSLTRLPRDAA